jgi:hypothetical protein
LEPQAEDSYFHGTFLMQYSGKRNIFSDHAFDEIAEDYLKKHPDLRLKLEQKRDSDTSFAKSWQKQLNFVYENSAYFEPDYLRYPVFRIEN